MAITPPYNWNMGVSDKYDFNEMQHAIQGRMLTVTYTIPEYVWSSRPILPDEIKLKLMTQMVDKMMEDKHIEFTKMVDPVNFDHRFAARIFVVPDTQVRILRTNNVATLPTK